ncbi:MAG: thioredoxin family protein [Cytophagaceae bacterium]|nr:thioredoxin family protein [Cytophagaceae bacterium]
MKKIFLNIVLILCSCSLSTSDSEKDELVGRTDEKEIYKLSWFSEKYKSYSPDSLQVENLKSKLPGYTMLVFGGAWCGDTHHYLPRFYKIMDNAGMSHDNIDLCLLNADKKSPEKLEKEYKIKTVPVFIILKDGKEVGRFTEKIDQPVETVLAELLK